MRTEMNFKNYYQILGLDREATDYEIRQSYRRLVKIYHPDTHRGEPERVQKFKEVTEAYEVLSDREKRRRFDELSANWKQFERNEQMRHGHRQTEPQKPDNRADYQEMMDLSFSDFFETFFGEESDNFWDKRLYKYDDKDTPRSRPRSEARPYQPKTKTPKASQEEASSASSEPEYSVEVSLEEVLEGTRKRVELKEDRKVIEVKVPAGVAEGSKIRIQTPTGDRLVGVQLKTHERYRVDGQTLHGLVEIFDYEAILGTSATVPTLTGAIQMKIPAGSQPGKIFRIRGQGLPTLKNKERGDLMVTLQLKVSTELDEPERLLIENFRHMRAMKEQAAKEAAERGW